jgi:hypothetical protein
MLEASVPIYLIRTDDVPAEWLVFFCEQNFSAPSPKQSTGKKIIFNKRINDVQKKRRLPQSNLFYAQHKIISIYTDYCIN